MSISKKVRCFIDDYLAMYESKEGYGIDTYNKFETQHAMAEAKYLECVSSLYRCSLISKDNVIKKIDLSLKRLENIAIQHFQGTYSWGLGFSYKEYTSFEPFLITSSLVLRALQSIDRIGLGSNDIEVKAVKGLNLWMNHYTINMGPSHDDTIMPYYSPNLKEPIFNAAAYGLATLKNNSSIDFLFDLDKSLKWMYSQYIPNLGWAYDTKSNVIDLLHQGYLLNAFLDAYGGKKVEDIGVSILSNFAGSYCFSDVLHLVLNEEQKAKSSNWIRKVGLYEIEVLSKPARLWSIGEVLVFVSRMTRDVSCTQRWKYLSNDLAMKCIKMLESEELNEKEYPRHYMHAMHGLTEYLEMLRSSSK